MLSNYALSLYRTLTRHRLYAILNTLGLALGIAVCTILFLVVRFERGFDSWVPHRDQIYRVNQYNSFPGRPAQDSPSTGAVLLPRLMAAYPQQITGGARLMDNHLVVRTGAQQAFENVEFADPSLWDFFPLRFIAGDPRTSLADSTSVVLSEATARKYFGTDQALGRQLSIVIDGQPRNYRVTGVTRNLPAASNLQLDVVIRFGPEAMGLQTPRIDSWNSTYLYTFVRIPNPADAAAINRDFPAFVDRVVTDGGPRPQHKFRNFSLVPLARMHFADANNTEAQKPGVDPLFVAALGIMGVVTLLIAVVNYVTLATARAGMRAREVAVRKVMGATRRALVGQFVGESVAVTLGAGLVAAALVEIVLPGVDAMLGEPIQAHYLGADGILLPLIGLCLIVGLAAGVYPALALSGFKPASVLASAKTPGGGRAGARVREGLAIGQFAIAICLMVCTAVIFAQMQYLRSADVGFRRDGLLIVKGLGDLQVAPQMRAILEAFRRTPGVISATASDRQPAGDSDNDGNVKLVRNPQIQPTLTFERIGPDYMRTYGLNVVAGRALDMAHGLDDKAGIDAEIIADRGINVMVNESAAKAYGFSDPKQILGERLQITRTKSGKPYIVTVAGVVHDVRFVSPRVVPPPQLYLLDSHLGPIDQPSSWSAAVRVRDGTQAQVRERLEAAWRSLVPGAPFQAETVQVTMKPFYDSDARRGQLFAAGAGLSAVIACLGLYGLAAFNTSRRVKEIGIRKTLGASTADVLRLLVGEFLRPVLWANLIAWPAAFFAMRWWLAGFDQRIGLNPAYFLAPSLAAIVVAVLTVAEQAMRVSRAEPSRALRYE